jgi:hypothetical protein
MKVECYYTGHSPELDRRIQKVMKDRGFKETGSGMLLHNSRRDLCFEKEKARDKIASIRVELPKEVKIKEIKG